jgi:hypothetical protein
MTDWIYVDTRKQVGDADLPGRKAAQVFLLG